MSNTAASHSVNKTLRHELIHLVVAGFSGLVIYFYSKNLVLGASTFTLSMFLDGDHLVDYSLYLKKFKKSFSFSEFLSGSYFKEWGKFITPFHSWEVAIFGLILFLTSNSHIGFAIFLALTGHYLTDFITNDVNKKAYFLLYRAKNGFKKIAIKRE